MISLNDINFKTSIAQETNGRMRVRLLALSHIKDGASHTKAAEYLKVSRRIVNDWVRKFNAEGLEGLKEKSRTGRPCALSDDQLKELKSYVLARSIKETGGRITAQSLVDYIQEKFQVEYGIHNIYRLLHQLNFSWITSRSKHPKKCEEVQEGFKKIPIGNDR